ncbi:1-phosphatidylinositol 4,5-bisphosphate phosphodiesterase beta-2 isoform X2 [Sphaerodactylus townsendi]|uniref:1-phosphatidylinositol 4,5-bisphosphate phosphodiesterase beta-2 isoform X2 n=1 Tax=Sphaerodactylus townsendi TaxID=933632 RepID=UPI0020270918|nr:1-phosphatidylinositol 4,5-bisphosphate phosphodiesterase beta-2 isoform X2 [Sphaerodactylus townsendi]
MSVLSPILTPPEVKEYLTKGERFIKWDDDTTNASPVILRVDPKGFYLYWTFQNKEIDFLDIASIQDTRAGKFAKIPKSQKLQEVFNLDFPDNNFLLKTLTVVTGPDMVDLTFHNFVSYKENVGKSWADDILAIAKNPFTYNACRYSFLEKIHVRLKLQLNADGKIPVRNIFQIFPADRKRVEAALSACHLPKGKNDGINPEDFPETVYKSFLMNLCPRPEIDEIFTSHHSKAKPYMTKEHLTKFINKKQRDSHLNDVLFPPAKPEQVQGLIEKYEPSGMNIQRGQLSPEGMVWFLCGPENSVISQDKLLLYQDMRQPISHYFINSSHNTYLTAGQFSGISSPEMYRQTLLAGCRCVELDCWKGKPPDEEPIITHGFTMTTEILFKDAIEAIAESAFKTSPYPVILSFENHVDSPKQQAKMAEYCRTIFGDMLLTEPLEKFPLKPGVPLPSPQDLLGKILIKNKKNQFTPGENQDTLKKGRSLENEAAEQPTPTDKDSTARANEVTEDVPESQEDLENLNEEEIKKMQSDEGTAGLEVTAYEEMSSLVNYIQPIKFDTFEISAHVAMQQNMALFEFNGQSGYLLKHVFMRRPDKQFDPFSVDRIDVVVASTLSITIISGQFLSDRSVKSYVEVELFGLPGDPKRRYRTKLTPTANSINPVWKEEAFVFEKIMMPELASLRIVVLEEGGKFIGQRIIPITAVCSGYHHICLRSESNMPLNLPSLFVYVEMKDYVPDSWADMTMALCNPIKFFSAHDKKSSTGQEADMERPSLQKGLSTTQINTNGLPNTTGTTSIPPSNGPAGTPGGKEEATKEPVKQTTVPQTASMEELQQMKLFGKLLKKQEKELKELERKASKRREDLLQRYTFLFTELAAQVGKKKMLCPTKSQKKKRSLILEDTSAGRNDAERAESPGPRVLELKEKLEEELLQLGEEYCDGIRKKKEQHSTEQIAKMIELAREKQACELKALRDSSESDNKELKKKLEAKRLDRIQAVAKNTSDKSAQERLKREINSTHIQEVVQMIKQLNEKQAKYQQDLEAKQTDCLEKIKAKEVQLQQEALAEYKEKVKALTAEVQDLAKDFVKVCFPLEAKTAKEETPTAIDDGDKKPKTQLQENNLMLESVQVDTQKAENDLELEESNDTQCSRL